jgi:hypothetical protein
MAAGAGKEDHVHDSVQWAVYYAIKRHRDLPDPIPWVEPSVNMPYLEACVSYVFGCGFGCTVILGALLEHTVRLAATDMEMGYPFAMSEEIWNRYKRHTIAQFHKDGILEKILTTPHDVEWWVKFAGERVRNKTVHLDVPLMIHDLGRFEEYVGSYRDTDDKDVIFSGRFWWGAPFHRTSDLIAIGFLRESTEQLGNVIRSMKWPEFREHWISQKWRYDSFFRKKEVWESLLKCYDANPITNVIDTGIKNPP